MNKITCILVVLFFASTASANEALKFANAAQQALYYDLIGELRCLVCQNQSLADSNADLARDLRKQTYDMVVNGANRQVIVDYMVARYGDFVLYNPPFKANTALLWAGPLLFTLFGFALGWRVLGSRRSADPLDPAKDNQVKALLYSEDTATR